MKRLSFKRLKRWILKNWIVIVCAIVGCCLFALGFNTIEYMCHYSPPENWCFIWEDRLCMPFWNAYMLGGILPFMAGAMMIGVVVGIAIPTLYRRIVKLNNSSLILLLITVGLMIAVSVGIALLLGY